MAASVSGQAGGKGEKGVKGWKLGPFPQPSRRSIVGPLPSSPSPSSEAFINVSHGSSVSQVGVWSSPIPMPTSAPIPFSYTSRPASGSEVGSLPASQQACPAARKDRVCRKTRHLAVPCRQQISTFLTPQPSETFASRFSSRWTLCQDPRIRSAGGRRRIRPRHREFLAVAWGESCCRTKVGVIE